jgi:hypothetical protein
MRKIIEARDTLTEVADFFHAVAHQEDLTISRGMTVAELARAAGTQVPRSLRGAAITSTSSRLPAQRRGQPLLVADYGPPRRGQGVMEFKRCIDVGTTSGPVTGSVKVCIDCSLTKMKCTITIVATGTIVIG